jgi:hypothetical protein
VFSVLTAGHKHLPMFATVLIIGSSIALVLEILYLIWGQIQIYRIGKVHPASPQMGKNNIIDIEDQHSPVLHPASVVPEVVETDS